MSACAYRVVSRPVLNSAIDRATFDTSVKPGENFFQYVNGGWIQNNPIPSAYGTWGTPEQLYCQTVVALNKIVEDLEKQTGPLDPDCRKLRDLYATATDEAKLEAAGAKPLAGTLERIAKISTPQELVAEAARLHLAGTPALFRMGVRQDEKQSNVYAVYVYQGGLGLPERDYYLGTTGDSKRIRDEYRGHVAKMLELLGDSPQAARRRRHGHADRDQARGGVADAGAAPRSGEAVQQAQSRKSWPPSRRRSIGTFTSTRRPSLNRPT